MPPQPATPTPGTPPAALAQFPPGDRSDVLPLIQAIEKLRGRRMITYFLDERGSIAGDAVRSIYSQLEAVGRQEQLDLWIHSHGGFTEVPWRIVQMVREYCTNFGALVTEQATSAATHLCLGADEIVMGPASLLGPVDPQRQHPLLPLTKDASTGGEVPVAVSVQDLKHAVEFVKREAGGADLTGEAYASVIGALFDKVHPLAIGGIEQSYSLSKLITRRVLSTHMDERKDGEQIDRLADALCDEFMSHAFPIGRIEAKRLGLKVTDAPADLYAAMWGLLNYYENLDRGSKPLPSTAQAVGPVPGGNVTYSSIGNIDTTDQRFDCLTFEQMTPEGTAQVRGSQWMRVGP
jgi:serine dehydrogenase proteinase